MQQLAVLVGISVLMTVGVYGLVGGIVKLDDVGLWLLQKKNSIAQSLGKFALWIMPRLMKTLAFVGTLAMFLVGGSIIAHNLPHSLGLHHVYEVVAHSVPSWLQGVSDITMNLIVGMIVGALVLILVTLASKFTPKKSPAH